jgi:hypothetical protein
VNNRGIIESGLRDRSQLYHKICVRRLASLHGGIHDEVSTNLHSS